MLIWLTIQLFQAMFGVTIQDDVLTFLLIFGFVELLAEIVLIITLIIAPVFCFIDEKVRRGQE